MGVAVSNPSGSLLIGLYYRPPNSGTDLDELEQALLHMNIYSCSACALVGDFNIDLLLESDPLSVDLVGRACTRFDPGS